VAVTATKKKHKAAGDHRKPGRWVGRSCNCHYYIIYLIFGIIKVH
jgi:hypothetical protein